MICRNLGRMFIFRQKGFYISPLQHAIYEAEIISHIHTSTDRKTDGQPDKQTDTETF